MKRIILPCVLILCVLLISCSLGQDEVEEQFLCKIDILDVGKADCIVINTGTRLVMIDTAERENLSVIQAYMSANEYTKIDTLILTHFDKDHIGNVSNVATLYGVDRVIESSFSTDTPEYIEYHSTLDQLGVEITKLTSNYSVTLDGCELEIDIPKKSHYKNKEDNNASLVISLRCGERKFLFCGDAMELRVKELVDAQIGTYDFVKLPYHGNYLDNYRDFLDMVKPSYGAITCSKRNPASPDTLILLDEYEVALYQTRYGMISVTTDGREITIEQ